MLKHGAFFKVIFWCTLTSLFCPPRFAEQGWGRTGLYGVRDKLGPCQNKRDSTEVGIHGGAGGMVFGDDDAIGEPDSETGGDDGVGWMVKVICIYPYFPLT